MDYVTETPKRAAAGALFLDECMPGWAQLLKQPLGMASTRTCVLAQLFGRFRTGAERLKLSDSETLYLGFRACSSELGNNLKAF